MNAGPDSLAAALAELQKNLPRIEKTERADVVTQKGSYSYTYADLANLSATILPLLGQFGLSWICKPTFDDEGRFVLAYSLLHISGGREDGKYPLPSGGTPQALGSAITYGRRYCLCSVTGVAPEDDDDGAAAEVEATANRGTAARRPTPPAKKAAPPKAANQAQRSQPANPPPLPTEDDTITPAQLKKLHVSLTEYGIGSADQKDAALAYYAEVTGRTVTSSKELTKDEARKIIDRLDSELQQPFDPAGDPPMDGAEDT